jgi:hypothetical protein
MERMLFVLNFLFSFGTTEKTLRIPLFRSRQETEVQSRLLAPVLGCQTLLCLDFLILLTGCRTLWTDPTYNNLSTSLPLRGSWKEVGDAQGRAVGACASWEWEAASLG